MDIYVNAEKSIDKFLTIIIIVKADTNNRINGGKHYRWTERHYSSNNCPTLRINIKA